MKMIPAIRDLPYENRLKHLKLPTLSYRRYRGDMIETYKILNSKYDEKVSNFLPLHKNNIPDPTKVRGHSKKLFKRKHSLKIRKENFSFRVVSIWNSLPEKIVSAPSVATFERRLDKFWSDQGVKYNFRESLKILHTNNAPYGSGSDEDHEDLYE